MGTPEQQPVTVDTTNPPVTPPWLVPAPDRSSTARRWLTVYASIGFGCVIGGGLVAAVTGPLEWAQGSWAAAYLVLVCGVAQAIIGAAPYLLSPASPDVGWPLLISWNLGNALVIGGTLARQPVVVDIGGAALLAALLMALRTVAGGRRSGVLTGYRVVLVLLAVSVPIGLVLAHLRAG